ncbi:MAG: hypothetical protein GQ564_08710 [Bacteroidales bacterium]|nr:hypothetical protein [Bacteroidales bacterium]
MTKKYFRVETKDIDTNLIYNSFDTRYGLNLDFKPYNHFLNTYLSVMKENNISVDFLTVLNNNIWSLGNEYLKILSDAIVDENYIDLQKVTNDKNHKNQRIEIRYVNSFVQNFDNENNFINFDNGTYLWEITLEMVRCNFFNKEPNRLDSKFFFTDIDSCNYYNDNYLNGIGKIYEIELIDKIEYFEGDMNLIERVQNHILFEDLINEFADYWRGKQTEKPIREVVFKGKFKYKNIT